MAAVGVREVLDPLRQAQDAPRHPCYVIGGDVRCPVDSQLHVGTARVEANRQASRLTLADQTFLQAVSIDPFGHRQRIAAMKIQYISHPKIAG